jgi:hypothetical protein
MSSIIRATTTSGLQVAPDNSGSLQLQTNGTTAAVTIDTSQNVGINKTPDTWGSGFKALQISNSTSIWTNPSSSTSYYSNNIYYNGSNRIFTANGYATEYQQNTDGYHVWFTGGTGTAGGTVSLTERMRIDSSGNVGIGNSSPAAKLDITAGSSNSLKITTDNTNTTIFSITRSTVTTVTHTLDNTGYKIINGGSGGLYLGYTGTSWTSLSDERFKTDLKPIENAAEKVSTLRAVTGRFKTDDEDKSRSFLIAQDIQNVFPEAVDASNPEQLGVSYTDTIPLLVAAIKEQQTIINDLKARIETLEAK